MKKIRKPDGRAAPGVSIFVLPKISRVEKIIRAKNGRGFFILESKSNYIKLNKLKLK